MRESLDVDDYNDIADEPTQPAKVEDAGPKHTPAEWAEKLGHIKHADARIPQSVTHADWMHAAADKLHGWSHHVHHYQSEPFVLTVRDYELALEAAAKYPLVAPHAKALVPSRVDSFKDFVPVAGKEK